jgi:hypothetical protein
MDTLEQVPGSVCSVPPDTYGVPSRPTLRRQLVIGRSLMGRRAFRLGQPLLNRRPGVLMKGSHKCCSR